MSPEFLFAIWSMALCRLTPICFTKYELCLLSSLYSSTFAGKRTYPPQRTQHSISIEVYLPTVTCNTLDLIQPVNHQNIALVIRSFGCSICVRRSTIIDILFALFIKQGKIYIFIELNPSNFKNCGNKWISELYSFGHQKSIK